MVLAFIALGLEFYSVPRNKHLSDQEEFPNLDRSYIYLYAYHCIYAFEIVYVYIYMYVWGPVAKKTGSQ